MCLNGQKNVPKAHEAEDPDENANGLRTDVLDGTHIDCLAVVAQPVTEIDTLDIQLAELASAGDPGQEESQQSIFNISMTPVLALDLGERGNVSGTKSIGLAGDGEDDEEGER